jgi:hypothetical protein
MDKGFYSRKNVDELVAHRDHFTLSVPLNNRWVQQAIDQMMPSTGLKVTGSSMMIS